MQAAERLARLIEPVHDRALAFARSLCRSRADGDDLYQEALLRALTKLDAGQLLVGPDHSPGTVGPSLRSPVIR
jgi:DNA-directed RNA polymerase specialized sigma24 family protein